MTVRNYTAFATPLANPGAHLREEQALTSDMALRLAQVCGTRAEFRMSFQTQHDLSKAAIAARDDLAGIQTLRVA